MTKAYMFGDNKSVVMSSTIPQSILNNRHNMLSYQRVKETIAAKILEFHWCYLLKIEVIFLANNGIMEKSKIQ